MALLSTAKSTTATTYLRFFMPHVSVDLVLQIVSHLLKTLSPECSLMVLVAAIRTLTVILSLGMPFLEWRHLIAPLDVRVPYASETLVLKRVFLALVTRSTLDVCLVCT
jgi:hypothetical protein